MRSENHSISVADKGEISSSWLIPENYQRALIIAHGAGKNMDSEFICVLHEGIAKHNILTVKFNFPYMEQGRKAPDRAPTLLACWQRVIDTVMEKTGLSADKIFLSGKSMGGRYATMLASETPGYGGIIAFGYPLHAPGKPDKARFEHLANISSPMLFFQGTRDSLCKLDKLNECIGALPNPPEIHIIEGGDHSFKVLKKLNRNQDEVMQEVIETSAKWISQ